MKIFILLISLFSASGLFAQKAILSGKVVDKSSGESIIGSIVEVSAGGNQVTGVATDFDGIYHLELEPGTYDIAVSYLSYARYTVSEVNLVPKEVTNIDIALESESLELTEIIVKADAIRSTEVALIALQRNASSIQDGVSSQQISRTGSSNAADAIRQLPGAVVEGDRFIVVRGLGDRYSISQLNGSALPSTDPYRNSSSMDLIPSQMIDNIISIKTFTPDLPGNFSGGLINIETKSIPDKFNLSLGINTSVNSQSSLINNFQTPADEGKWDWLGFEDGTRSQPGMLLDEEIRNQLSSSTYLDARQPGNDDVRTIFHESARSLSNTFVPMTKSTPVNMGFNFSVGDRLKLFSNDLGYTLAVNYAKNYQHYENATIATYINTNTDFLFPYQDLQETRSVENPNLGGLFNLAYKVGDNHIINGNIIFNNDAEIVARSQSGSFLGQVSNSMAEFNTRSTEFTQRQMANFQLGGKHAFPGLNNSTLEWNSAMTRSFQHEPDLKYFAFTSVCEEDGSEEGCEYYINNAEYAFPYHFFRKLKDKNFEAKLDLTIPMLNGKHPNSLKIGGFYSNADRAFEEYRYQLNNSGVPAALNFSTFNGDFNAFFDPSNFGIIDTLYKADGTLQRYVTGYHYVNQINAKNFYTGNQQISAAYAMATFHLTSKLKVIGGLRMEMTDMKVVSQDSTVEPGNISLTDYLYSANIIYALSENSNLRAAASRTLARPNMRELAPFVQFDTKNGFFNVGNPGLKRTLISNLDVRYENYPKAGELIAVSAFYKNFRDPIIRAFNPKATIPELSFINVDEASVLGAEIEIRKSLSFISYNLRDFYFNTNFAVIHSKYEIPQEEIENSQNIDPEYNETTRPFQGQAPFIVNAILSYNNPTSGWEVALAYNVSGKRLYNISLFATPDIYEQPVSQLNFKLSKRFAEFYQVSFNAKNILDSVARRTHSFKGQQYIAESYALGRILGVSLTYQIK